MAFFVYAVKVAGNVVTLSEFEKRVAVGFEVTERAPARDDLTDEERLENAKRSASRARRELADAINANFGWCPRKNRFGQWSLKFLTLTYKENMQDYARLARDFDLFMKKLRYHLDTSFDYVAVPEQQKRGAWHLHILLYCPFIPIDTLKRIWNAADGQGSFKVNLIDQVSDVGAYVAKYLLKDLSPDSPLHGKKRFWASQGFTKKAHVLRFPRPIETPILKTFQQQQCVAKVREYEYDNEWTGKANICEITLFPSPKSKRLIENLLEAISCEGKEDDPVYQGLRAKEREILALKPSGVLLSSVPSLSDRERAWERAGLVPGGRRVHPAALSDTLPERSPNFTRAAAGRGAYRLAGC